MLKTLLLYFTAFGNTITSGYFPPAPDHVISNHLKSFPKKNLTQLIFKVMSNDFYSAVTLDGRELQNLTIDEIKNLFYARQVNQNSLVFSTETQNWQMLKRVFDVSQWIPAATQIEENYQHQHPLPDESESADSHYQTPENQALPTNDFPPDSANDYSQSNQNRRFNQANTASDKHDFANHFKPANSAERTGARQAAVFICINAVFFLV